jgi:hypothetical protein
MRIPSSILASNRVVSAALLAFGILLVAFGAKPATAQGTLTNQPTVGAIRLGVYIPTSSKVTSPVGKYFFPVGGLAYTFQQDSGNRSDIGADYIERSSSGSDVRVIPLTVSETYYGGPRAQGVRPYWSVGVGAYFVHVSVPNPNPNEVVGNPGAAQVNHTDTVLGGFLGLGLDFPANYFIDLRYHQVSEVSHVNTSGFELCGGYRF